MGYGGSGGAMAPPPRVRFDALSEAWGMLTRQMGAWVLASLVYTVIVGGIVGVLYIATIAGAIVGGGSDGPNLGAVFGGSMLMMVVSMVAGGFFIGGFQTMALKQLRGEQIAVGDLFSAGYAALPMIGAYLLIGLGTGLGSYLLVLPGLLLASLWMLTGTYIVDQRMGSIEAMTASWNAIKNDIWNALALYLVTSLAVGIGSLLCGVGMLFTLPLYFLVPAVVYRDFHPDRFAPSETSSFSSQ